MLLNENRCDQESGDDEKDVDADEAAGNPRGEGVECHHREDGYCTQTIYFGAISHGQILRPRSAGKRGIGRQKISDD
jgi:hypothetical protein